MRLAYFSPLPPSKSGIADYSSEILPFLALGADISVFVEDGAVGGDHSDIGYDVFPAGRFETIDGDRPFDLCIYHQGNNPFHEYIYKQALKHPGVVVLHEHCLHHLIAETTLGRKDAAAYWNELFFAYGRRGAQFAEMRERDVGSEYQQFLLPLNRRLISRSLGVIVHNRYAASQLEGLDGKAVEVIPHHLSPRVLELNAWEAAECRRSLGLPEGTLLIGSFGFVTRSKRIPVLLAAFRRLLAQRPDSRCIIAGQDHGEFSVRPIIEQMGLKDVVTITGYTTESEFFRYLKAVDIVVNLRYPTAGETSGTLIRALGAGKPVILSDHGQFGELPDDICLKVALGPNEETDLYKQLRTLAYQPEPRDELGRRAMEWARIECDIGRSASRYLAFAERIIRRKRRLRQKERDLPSGPAISFSEPPTIKLDHTEAISYIRGFFEDNADAMGYLEVHGERIIKTVELVPVGTSKQKLLELSSYLQMTPLIVRDGHYGEVCVTNWWEGEPRIKMQRIRNSSTGLELSFAMQHVDVERDRFPYEDQYFDVALSCELIEHLREDPMHMLTELNRVLKWDGLLILTTPNISSAFSIQAAMAGRSPYIYGSYNRKSPADRHSREYTTQDVRLVLESAGFQVIKLFTEDLWHATDEKFLQWLDQTGVPREYRGDNIFAVGRKMSQQIDRFPQLIYD